MRNMLWNEFADSGKKEFQMARARKALAPTVDQLRLQVDQIPAASPRAIVIPPPISIEPEPMSAYITAIPRKAFGGWLLTQKGHSEWRDVLVSCAKTDPAFPRSGDPDDVRQHLSARGADGDMFEALDDAEMDWLSL
jgi:hypothetical protein